MATNLSIIVPTFNEALGIERHLRSLQSLRERGVEVLVVDGGSTDGTVALAVTRADVVLQERPGRARQMNAGVSASTGNHLLFLHADTFLPDRADHLIAEALSIVKPGTGTRCWGRFDVRLSGTLPMLAVIAAAMNRRSRLSGIATGDQALFMTRQAFIDVGGFPDQPLMEDIEMCRRLKRLSPPACLHEKVISSGRRWERHGTWRTILLMWRLRFAYWLGRDASRLATSYRQVR